MSEYKLEVKQIVDYPRCRIYREFIQSLIADQNIRTNGSSGLFHYSCAHSTFRCLKHRGPHWIGSPSGFYYYTGCAIFG